MKRAYLLFWLTACLALYAEGQAPELEAPYFLVLGVAQDGGYPHIGCARACCQAADSLPPQLVTALALADPASKKWWLFEATPDITKQLNLFRDLTENKFHYLPEGIFLTHAHMGHYTGLMYLGREALGAKGVPVFAMPKMATFLRQHGPWSQLVTLKNIVLNQMQENKPTILSDEITVVPLTVPHRDEFSETVGFRIVVGSKKYLFIPDIDKWQKWPRSIRSEVQQVDIAFLDATFYSTDELPGRSLAEIPHPTVQETLALIPKEGHPKIHFIHFNHTNPLLWNLKEQQAFEKAGGQLAKQSQKY